MMGGTRRKDTQDRGSTQQGPNAAGPGDRHARPPEDAPQPWGTGEKPFHPRGGAPAADPEAKAEELLARHRTGQAAAGNAGPASAGKDRT